MAVIAKVLEDHQKASIRIVPGVHGIDALDWLGVLNPVLFLPQALNDKVVPVFIVQWHKPAQI
jgi:hypothetical protein